MSDKLVGAILILLWLLGWSCVASVAIIWFGAVAVLLVTGLAAIFSAAFIIIARLNL